MRFIFILIVVSITSFLAACAPTIPEPAYAEPIVEELLIGLSNGDYDIFSSHMSAEMASKIDQESFLALKQQISSKIGVYELSSIRFNRAMEEGEMISVFYNAAFTEERGVVSVNVIFSREGGKAAVEGLWLNSPKLRN